ARERCDGWERRAVGEGVKSCPRSWMREIRLSGSILCIRSCPYKRHKRPEIAPELTGHGLPLSKCEAYNRGRCTSRSDQASVHDRYCLGMGNSMSKSAATAAANLFRFMAAAVR